jgi:hypothetical protein
MNFKGSIVTLKANVTASGDPTRRVTVELHETQPGAFASLDYLIGTTVEVEITEEKIGPFEVTA